MSSVFGATFRQIVWPFAVHDREDGFRVLENDGTYSVNIPGTIVARVTSVLTTITTVVVALEGLGVPVRDLIRNLFNV